MMNMRRGTHKIEEESSMATIVREKDHAFVLSPEKIDEFIQQDNSKFKQMMQKYEKFTGKRGRSISEKK